MQDFPRFFIWNQIANKFTIYNYEDEYNPTPATYDDCKNLECAVSWGHTNIESRLEDFFAGRLNKAVEVYKAKPI